MALALAGHRGRPRGRRGAAADRGLWLLRDLLPVPPASGCIPGPLVLAAGFGLLTAGAFVLWPLGRAARIPGAALFRDSVLPTGCVAGAVAHRGQRRGWHCCWSG